MLGDGALVGRVGVAVDQAHADRVDGRRPQLLDDGIQLARRRGGDHVARGRGALGDLDDQLARHRRGRELDLQVVHVVAVLVADQQRVTEAGGRHDGGPADLALDEGVGDEGRGVHDRRRDVGRLDAGLGEQLAHAGAHAVERRLRRRQHLLDDDLPGGRVEQHEVGERAADVDGEAPIRGAHATLPSAAVRGGAKTSRIHTSLSSSSPMKLLSPCQMFSLAR